MNDTIKTIQEFIFQRLYYKTKLQTYYIVIINTFTETIISSVMVTLR